MFELFKLFSCLSETVIFYRALLSLFHIDVSDMKQQNLMNKEFNVPKKCIVHHGNLHVK